MKCQNRKVFLFADNCAAHPKDISGLRNVRVELLPANTTSRMQPLDAGVIRNNKHYYKKCVIRRFLAEVEQGSMPKRLMILDAMHYLATSWKSVTLMTIKHCFQNCGGRGVGCAHPILSGENMVDCDDREMDDTMTVIGAQISYNDFVTVGNNVVTFEHQSVTDIVAEHRTELGDSETEDEPDEREAAGAPTFASMIAALDKLRRYSRMQEIDESEKKLRALEKSLLHSWTLQVLSKCQTKIGDYFMTHA